MTDQLQPLRDSFAAMAANFDSMAALADIYREERDQALIRAEAAEAELRDRKKLDADFERAARELGACCGGCPGCSTGDCNHEALLRRAWTELCDARREAAGYQKIAKEAADAEKPGLLVLLVSQDGAEVRIFGPDRGSEENFGEIVARWWKLVQSVSDGIEVEDAKKERDAAQSELREERQRREAMEKRLETMANWQPPMIVADQGLANALRDKSVEVLEMGTELNELREATRWRPVSELPPLYLHVLICAEIGMWVAQLTKHHGWLVNGVDGITPTHWMPLPEGPKQ